MSSLNPAVFDAIAQNYDDDFTNHPLGRMLRKRVWEKLAEHFSSGQHVLELTCGTGEDALWLAKRGVKVTATDASIKMVHIARAKIERAGAGSFVCVQQVSLQQIISGHLHEKFDGAFSNFGGLNTIAEWKALAAVMAKMVKPQGRIVFVPMGPFCPWEVGWFLARGKIRRAFRRFEHPASAQIADSMIPVWFPSAGRLRADFAPWVHHLQTESLALWLPPTYLRHLVERWPLFFSRLDRFEKATARFTKGWGDHYIIVFERK
jgi:ubiquinone/menaquinone biosynthesis C-methylase UbiE